MMVSSDLHTVKVHAQVSNDTRQEALPMVQLLEDNDPLDEQTDLERGYF